MNSRTESLVSRLRKGTAWASQTLGGLSNSDWHCIIYDGPPPWSLRDLAAHLLSAEDGLRRLAQDITAGGAGAPPGLHHDELNAAEQARLAGISALQLVRDLGESRQETIRWVATLAESDLDRAGRHPALGQISVEAHVGAIYGHGLMHLRDIARWLRERQG